MAETASPPTDRTEESLRNLLEAIDEVPSIPETLIRILTLLEDPRSSSGSLAKVIRHDAPLMAKVLRLANSPYYSGGRELADIKSCIGVLGFKTVRQVAVCVSIATNLVSACRVSQSRIDYRELWRHSVATGLVARELAARSGDADPEQLFAAGLLHDLGKFVIVLRAAPRYDQVIADRAASGRPLVEAEREAFGFDHAMAGEAFARSWRFPGLLASCARQHHDPPGPAAAAGTPERAAALVQLANVYAHRLEEERSDLGHEPRSLDRRALHQATGLPIEMVEASLPAVRQAMQDASAFFELA